MAEALPYLKSVNISTHPGAGQGQKQQQGMGQMPMNLPQMPGQLSQPLMPIDWQRRGGFRPGTPPFNPKLGNMNFPTLPPNLQSPINMFPVAGGGAQQTQPLPPSFPLGM